MERWGPRCDCRLFSIGQEINGREANSPWICLVLRLSCRGVVRGEEGRTHEKASGDEHGQVGVFSENQEGRESRKRYLEVVHDGEPAGGDAACAVVPQEEAQARSNRSEVGEYTPLKGGDALPAPAAGRDARRQGDEEGSGIGIGEAGAFVLRDDAAFQCSIGELPGGEADVRDLDEEESFAGDVGT